MLYALANYAEMDSLITGHMVDGVVAEQNVDLFGGRCKSEAQRGAGRVSSSSNGGRW